MFDFDEFVQLAKDLKFTKRNLSKTNATLFDPLGLISPITLQGKLLFKLLCIDMSDWDDELDDIIKQKFLKFLNDLKIIKQISMSRFIMEHSRNRFVILSYIAFVIVRFKVIQVLFTFVLSLIWT